MSVLWLLLSLSNVMSTIAIKTNVVIVYRKAKGGLLWLGIEGLMMAFGRICMIGHEDMRQRIGGGCQGTRREGVDELGSDQEQDKAQSANQDA